MLVVVLTVLLCVDWIGSFVVGICLSFERGDFRSGGNRGQYFLRPVRFRGYFSPFNEFKVLFGVNT